MLSPTRKRPRPEMWRRRPMRARRARRGTALATHTSHGTHAKTSTRVHRRLRPRENAYYDTPAFQNWANPNSQRVSGCLCGVAFRSAVHDRWPFVQQIGSASSTGHPADAVRVELTLRQRWLQRVLCPGSVASVTHTAACSMVATRQLLKDFAGHMRRTLTGARGPGKPAACVPD